MLNRKVQGEPQSQATANPWHQEEKMTEINEQLHKKHKISSLSLLPMWCDHHIKTMELYQEVVWSPNPTVQLIKVESIAINFDWADNYACSLPHYV